jgi:hypothetical protein
MTEQERWQAEPLRRVRDEHEDKLVIALPKSGLEIISRYIKPQWFSNIDFGRLN